MGWLRQYVRKNASLKLPLSSGKLKAEFATVRVEVERRIFCEVNDIVRRIRAEGVSAHNEYAIWCK